MKPGVGLFFMTQRGQFRATFDKIGPMFKARHLQFEMRKCESCPLG